MFIYGKTATNAIAVISYLAGVAPRRVGSAEIAKARQISPVHTAKLLTQLARAGLLNGQPGPGGGYVLAVPPDEIRLIDIVTLFEQINERSPCPFGPDWCENGAPCPLHDAISDMMERSRRYLEETRLSVFVPAEKPAECQQIPVKKAARKSTTHTRACRPTKKSI